MAKYSPTQEQVIAGQDAAYEVVKQLGLGGLNPETTIKALQDIRHVKGGDPSTLFGTTQAGKRVGRQAKLVNPAYLQVVRRQLVRLVEIDAPGFVGVTKTAYKREMTEVIYEAVYRPDLAVIDLRDLILVDPRLTASFLAQAADVVVYIDNVDACTPYGDTPVLTEPAVIQAQFGQKYRNTRPRTTRDSLDVLEQGISVVERLHGHLYDPKALDVVNTDIIGSVAPGGIIPYLCRRGGEAGLYSSFVDGADSDYGAGSRGRLLGN
jgi:hypothetical protein